MRNVEITVQSRYGVEYQYKYVVPTFDGVPAKKILEVNVGQVINYTATRRKPTHKMEINEDGDFALVCQRREVRV